MSSKNYEPRRSSLANRHPAIPADAQHAAATAEAPSTKTPETAETAETEPLRATAAPGRSRKMTINVGGELQEQAKDAYWLVRDHHRTFSDWVAAAIAAAIEQTKSEAGVEELPRRPGGGLPTGRPLG